MINLEELALSRAQNLAQAEDGWSRAIESKCVVDACTVMSDGEIQQVFSSVSSPSALLSICEAFVHAAENGENSPFQVWKDHFTRLNIGLLEAADLWEKVWPAHRHFQNCLNSMKKRS